LVLTRDEAIDRLSEVFVVLATTVIRGLPTEVELGPADGMPRACVLNADHTATLAKGNLGELIHYARSGGGCLMSVRHWIAQLAADATTCGGRVLRLVRESHRGRVRPAPKRNADFAKRLKAACRSES
jgi:hypothetical protein